MDSFPFTLPSFIGSPLLSSSASSCSRLPHYLIFRLSASGLLDSAQDNSRVLVALFDSPKIRAVLNVNIGFKFSSDCQCATAADRRCTCGSEYSALTVTLASCTGLCVTACLQTGTQDAERTLRAMRRQRVTY